MCHHTGESVVAYGDVFPDVAQEFFLADDARAVLNQVKEKADGLGLEGQDLAGLLDRKRLGVEDDITELIADTRAMHSNEL